MMIESGKLMLHGISAVSQSGTSARVEGWDAVTTVVSLSEMMGFHVGGMCCLVCEVWPWFVKQKAFDSCILFCSLPSSAVLKGLSRLKNFQSGLVAGPSTGSSVMVDVVQILPARFGLPADTVLHTLGAAVLLLLHT